MPDNRFAPIYFWHIVDRIKKKHRENPLEAEVLSFLAAHRTGPYSSKQLAKRLRVKKKEFKNFRRYLRDLAQDGRIQQVQEGLF